MSRLYLVLMFLFSCFLQAGCYVQSAKNITDNPKDEEKVSDPYAYDFGQVKKGEVLRHNFIFKNSSQNTLNIKDVTTSCGCTLSKVEKKILLPGETTSIEVQFDTKGYSGPTQQFIYVHTDNLDASTPLSINSESNRTIDNPIFRFIIKADVK